MTTITLDATHFQSADDETTATTVYGGYVLVGNQRVTCSGTDRDSTTCFDAIAALVLQNVGITLDDLSDEYLALTETIANHVYSNEVFDLTLQNGRIICPQDH